MVPYDWRRGLLLDSMHQLMPWRRTVGKACFTRALGTFIHVQTVVKLYAGSSYDQVSAKRDIDN